jgi:pseudo-rSAM protein
MNLKAKNTMYFFTIEPYVYVDIKKNKCLLYNTINNEKIITSNKFVVNMLKIIKRFSIAQKISLYEIKKYNLLDFFSNVKKYYIGDLLIIDNLSNKPPVIQRKKIENKYDATFLRLGDVKVDILSIVKEVNLFFLNECKSKCDICTTAYTQTTHCYNKKFKKVDYEKIVDFLRPIVKLKRSVKFNFVTNDLSNLDLLNFLKITSNSIHQKEIIVNIDNYNQDIVKKIFDNKLISSLKILINRTNKIPTNMELVNSLEFKQSVKYNLLVENDTDLTYYKKIMNKFKISNYNFTPIYNKQNYQFFKNNVFLNDENIFKNKLSMKQILFNQNFNVFNMGKLYILQNGDVLTNLNKKKIGNIKTSKINDIVYNELVAGKAWRLLRQNIVPCKSCLLCNVCPPVSNYELTIGRNDLCQVNV